MKEIIAVIACELQTIGEKVKNKEETMKQDWIVLDFWQGVGEVQGLDRWWPSGRGDVHGPRREDPWGLCYGPQRPEVQGKGEGHQGQRWGPPRGPAQGFPRAWPGWEVRHSPSTQGWPAQTEPRSQGALLGLASSDQGQQKS